MLEAVNQLSARDYRKSLVCHFTSWIRFNINLGALRFHNEEYKRTHEKILATDRWIIDGFGCMETVWLRLNEADSLVFVDLPLYVHFWWVTKRLITGSFIPPEGWHDKSPILKSSINSYRVLWLCHKYLTPRYREYVDRAQNTKSVYHIRSTEEISQFFESIVQMTNDC